MVDVRRPRCGLTGSAQGGHVAVAAERGGRRPSALRNQGPRRPRRRAAAEQGRAACPAGRCGRADSPGVTGRPATLTGNPSPVAGGLRQRLACSARWAGSAAPRARRRRFRLPPPPAPPPVPPPESPLGAAQQRPRSAASVQLGVLVEIVRDEPRPVHRLSRRADAGAAEPRRRRLPAAGRGKPVAAAAEPAAAERRAADPVHRCRQAGAEQAAGAGAVPVDVAGRPVTPGEAAFRNDLPGTLLVLLGCSRPRRVAGLAAATRGAPRARRLRRVLPGRPVSRPRRRTITIPLPRLAGNGMLAGGIAVAVAAASFAAAGGLRLERTTNVLIAMILASAALVVTALLQRPWTAWRRSTGAARCWPSGRSPASRRSRSSGRWRRRTPGSRPSARSPTSALFAAASRSRGWRRTRWPALLHGVAPGAFSCALGAADQGLPRVAGARRDLRPAARAVRVLELRRPDGGARRAADAVARRAPERPRGRQRAGLARRSACCWSA